MRNLAAVLETKSNFGKNVPEGLNNENVRTHYATAQEYIGQFH
jgi:hypothetical protein